MSDSSGSRRRFVGRGDAVEALRRDLEDARAGGGGVSLIVGDAGVGKSLLLDELSTTVAARGVHVVRGQATGGEEPAPYSWIESALGEGLAVPELRPPDRVGSEVDPRVLKALGLAGESPRDAVLERIVDRLLDWTGRGPTAVLLDDLPRADESSLAAIEQLRERLAGRPLWIVATTRPLASLSDARRARVREFEQRTGARSVPLRPFHPGEVASFLRVIDPDRDHSVEEVDRSFVETGGNPLLLERRTRLAAAGHEPRPRATAPPVPLDVEEQRVLDVAAVLGSEFGFPLLLGTTGIEEEKLAEIVDRLVDRGFLFERPGERLEFPEDRLREAAYGRLSERRRRQIHRRAGETREAIDAPGSARIFGLARDFYAARDERKSLEYNRRAAEIAEAAGAPDVARDFLGRALESLRGLSAPDPAEEGRLVLDLARLTYELGALEESERTLRDYLGRPGGGTALSPNLRATLEILHAQVLTARGEQPASAAIAERVLADPALGAEPLLRIGAHHQRGLALYYEGRYPESLAEHTEELRLARELGHPRVVAHALKWHSALLGMMGESDRALVEAREVASALDQLGSAGESAQGHLFLGNMLADNKSSPLHRTEAIAELRKAIRFGEEGHDPRRVGWAHYYIAELLREAGKLSDARESAQFAVDALGKMGDKVGQGVALKIRGQVALALGDLDAADADLHAARESLRGLNHRLEEIDVGLRLAQLARARGNRAEAQSEVAELEQRQLSTARPDLVREFEELRRSLAS